MDITEEEKGLKAFSEEGRPTKKEEQKERDRRDGKRERRAWKAKERTMKKRCPHILGTGRIHRWFKVVDSAVPKMEGLNNYCEDVGRTLWRRREFHRASRGTSQERSNGG